jgi:hypothetical protein
MLRFLSLLICCAPLSAANFTVTNTADSGAGSLRQAILDSNANGTNDSDFIGFNIPGAGPHVIAPNANLPELLSETITIDGYTQAGSSPNTRTTAQGGLDTQLRIVLSGQNIQLGSGFIDGLRLGTASQLGTGTITVRGLAIARFENQIRVAVNTPGAVVIEGNYLGSDAAGVAPPHIGGSGWIGLNARSYRGNMRIGGLLPAQRNLFVGTGVGATAGVGIAVEDLVGGIIVQGNQIGTDPSGTGARGHTAGVRVTGVSPTSTGGVLIGGTDPNARNLISGNFQFGISLQITGSGLVERVNIEGNWIGTDSSGNLPLPNGRDPAQHGGITRNQNFPGNSRSRIGGSLPGQANRIAFNTGRGIIASGNSLSGFGGTLEIGNNEIYRNTGIAFDIVEATRVNDPGDGDNATNRMQNYPVDLSATRPAVLQIQVGFRVDTAVANASYPLRVDFFRASASGDVLELIGSTTVAAIDAQMPRSALVSSTRELGFIVAMATDAVGNSSEFSDVLDIDRIFINGFED